jgi:hypothetical protein
MQVWKIKIKSTIEKNGSKACDWTIGAVWCESVTYGSVSSFRGSSRAWVDVLSCQETGGLLEEQKKREQNSEQPETWKSRKYEFCRESKERRIKFAENIAVRLCKAEYDRYKTIKGGNPIPESVSLYVKRFTKWVNSTLSVKLNYTRPQVHSLNSSKSLACVSGSVASTSGWECLNGTTKSNVMCTNGATRVRSGRACAQGSNAIGKATGMGDTACDVGVDPINTASGNTCVNGGDKTPWW